MALRALCCLLLLLLLVCASRQATSCDNTDPCKDQPDCTGCAPGDKVPDPRSCHRFYVCDEGGEHKSLPVECGDDEVFDPISRSCVPGTECEPCPAVLLPRRCKYEFSNSLSTASLADCGTYYESNEHGRYIYTCKASTPFFNGVDCQSDAKLCCHCRPYCRACDENKLIVDPLDCRRYYRCPDHVPAVPIMSATCRKGEKFDATLQSCSASAPCDMHVSCFNVVGADGCINPYTCVAAGSFARCPKQCTPDYYHCTGETLTFQDAKSCPNGLVFHPDNHTCVAPDDCPYSPAVITIDIPLIIE